MLAAGCTAAPCSPPPASGWHPQIAEFGTGVGVGTAWMASAMPAECTLFTAEIDPALAEVARGLFAGDPRVEVITGDATAAMAGRGPFDLIFVEVVLPDLQHSLLVGTRIA